MAPCCIGKLRFSFKNGERGAVARSEESGEGLPQTAGAEEGGRGSAVAAGGRASNRQNPEQRRYGDGLQVRP